MTAFVEECRKEWKRLGVPDLLADEMAADLEADLVEAQADGVSTAEIVGESDPRRFAATWASERGLVAEPQPQKRRKRFWLVLGGAFVLMFFFVLILVGGLFATATVSLPPVRSAPKPIRAFALPNLVGLRACQARRIVLGAGLKIEDFPRSRCDAIVVAERPARGTMIPFRQRKRITVTLRLRG